MSGHSEEVGLMRRKIVRANIKRLRSYFRSINQTVVSEVPPKLLTFEDMAKSKAKGQECYSERLIKAEILNPRQLKKYRNNQKVLGYFGSQYGGICKVKLKPASASYRKS